MNGREIYQELFELMEPELPDGWSSVVLRAEYGESSYEIEFFVKDGSGIVEKCFDLPGAAFDDYYSLFEKMDALLSSERLDSDNGAPWSTMTMVVESSGAFKVDYGYDDDLEEPMAVREKWRNKYLQ